MALEVARSSMIKMNQISRDVVSHVASLPTGFTDVEGPWSIRRIAKTHVKGPFAIGELLDPYYNLHGHTTTSSIESLRCEANYDMSNSDQSYYQRNECASFGITTWDQ